MSWLSSSSIGRKVVMSVTGTCLVLFLLFHASMNIVAILDVFNGTSGYEAICEFLGANWYALIGTAGLAFLVCAHIVYAFVLNALNYRARGRERYAIPGRQKEVEWASLNMLVLGIIVVLGIGLHLFNFWSKMQLQEIRGFMPDSGTELIEYTFSKWYFAALYIVWLAALWFHLTHGIWSAMHTLGWNNNIWMKRWKCIANIIATVIILMFVAVVIFFYVLGNCPCISNLCAI